MDASNSLGTSFRRGAPEISPKESKAVQGTGAVPHEPEPEKPLTPTPLLKESRTARAVVVWSMGAFHAHAQEGGSPVTLFT
jgi:hypothetical protein